MRKINISLMVVVLLLAAMAIFVGFRWGDCDKVTVQGFVEQRSLRLASKVAGRIEKMFVEEGDSVRVGDTLYIISTPELNAKLQQVRAMLSAAKALETKANAGTRKPIIRSAHDMWRKAQAGVMIAQQTYDRVQRLCDEGVTTLQKRDEAYAALEAARATEQAAAAQYLLAVEGASPEDKAAAAAQVREAQGAVEEVARYMADRVVRSPVDGVVATVVANAGEIVGSGYPAVIVAENGTAKAYFNIPETLLSQISMGEKFDAKIPALGQKSEFEVCHISVEADYATQSATSARGDFDIRTFEVQMRPLECAPLRAGMSVLIELTKPSSDDD